MKSVPHLFADVKAALEDMHGIAVEGRAAGLSSDIHGLLLRELRSGAANLQWLLTGIALLLLFGGGER